MRIWSAAFLAIACASVAQGKVVTETVEYTHAGTTFAGYLAYDDAASGPRPGVLVVHQWMGLTDYEKRRTRMLAELGYVALAADVYGKGVRPTDASQAREQAGRLRGDPQLFRDRLNASLEQLKQVEAVDSARVAAIGYCFGGGGVLELARSGADLAGVVSFHGSLGTADAGDARGILGKVMVLHGAADPHVPPQQVHEFVEEMEAAGVDYQLVMFGGAVHAFTQPDAGDDPSAGAAYDEVADRRSWQYMQVFFDEIFGAR